MVIPEFTLGIVVKEGKVLLGKKIKPGFGFGLWNGFGGKKLPEEGRYDCLCREASEEFGIAVIKASEVGFLMGTFNDGTIPSAVYVYLCHRIGGTPQATDELIPGWFDLDKIPYRYMCPSDIHWLPHVLRGEKFVAHIHFSDFKDLRSMYHHIEVVKP